MLSASVCILPQELSVEDFQIALRASKGMYSFASHPAVKNIAYL